MRDLANSLGVVSVAAPATLTATTTTNGVDLLGFNSAMFLINTGAIAGSGNFTPKLQESDDNATFTDVAAGDQVGVLPSALAASAVVKAGYIGNKRYVRALLTLNSGTSIVAGVIAIRGRASSKPVA